MWAQVSSVWDVRPFLGEEALQRAGSGQLRVREVDGAAHGACRAMQNEN